jgi:hypothetical protein
VGVDFTRVDDLTPAEVSEIRNIQHTKGTYAHRPEP